MKRIAAFFFMSAAVLAFSAVRAADEDRVRQAVDRLENIVQYAKSNNAASPNLVYDLESVVYELRQSLSSGGYDDGSRRRRHHDGDGPRRATPVYDDGRGPQQGGAFGAGFGGGSGQFSDDSIPSRPDWNVYGSLNNTGALKDKRRDTRADSGTPDYKGYQVTVDFGRLCRGVHKVVQDHGTSKDDYPEGYLIEVSPDGMRWFEVFRGKGSPGYSTAVFSKVDAQYVRITATAQKKNRSTYWSIHELGIE